MGIRLARYKTSSVLSHRDLTERSLENQHPIQAITGLEEALQQIHQDMTHLDYKVDGITIIKNKNQELSVRTVPDGMYESFIDMVFDLYLKGKGS